MFSAFVLLSLNVVCPALRSLLRHIFFKKLNINEQRMKKQQQQADCDPDIWTLASLGGRVAGGVGYVIFDNSRRVFHTQAGLISWYNYFLMNLFPLSGSELFIRAVYILYCCFTADIIDYCCLSIYHVLTEQQLLFLSLTVVLCIHDRLLDIWI